MVARTFYQARLIASSIEEHFRKRLDVGGIVSRSSKYALHDVVNGSQNSRRKYIPVRTGLARGNLLGQEGRDASTDLG